MKDEELGKSEIMINIKVLKRIEYTQIPYEDILLIVYKDDDYYTYGYACVDKGKLPDDKMYYWTKNGRYYDTQEEAEKDALWFDEKLSESDDMYRGRSTGDMLY